MPTGDQLREKVGSCPQCGAPLYSTGRPGDTGIPEIEYTCKCRLSLDVGRFPKERKCEHCYCQQATGTTVTRPHVVCCKCGDRKLQSGTHFVTTETVKAGETISPPYPMESNNISCNVQGCMIG